MPSDLPKVSVYLQPATFDALDACARAVGQSRSRLVADMLDAAVPVFKAMTDAALVLQNANEMQRNAFRATASEMEAIGRTVEQLKGDVLALLPQLPDDDPRPSNTGVRK